MSRIKSFLINVNDNAEPSVLITRDNGEVVDVPAFDRVHLLHVIFAALDINNGFINYCKCGMPTWPESKD